VNRLRDDESERISSALANINDNSAAPALHYKSQMTATRLSSGGWCLSPDKRP
jgi:hypothetical protein